MGKKRGGAGLGGAVPVVRSGGVPVLGPAGGGRRFAVCRGDESPGGLQSRGQPRSHGHPGPGLLFARRRRGLPSGGPRAPGLCYPGPQPQLRPGGGNPAFRRRAGGQFLCEGQHRLRHGFKRRPPGGALGPPETGWQREILIYHTHTSEAYSQSYTGFTTRIWRPAPPTRSKAWWPPGRP